VEVFCLPATNFPSEVEELLFASWVQYFGRERLGLEQYGHGGTVGIDATYNFGNPTEKSFSLTRSPSGEWSLNEAKGIAEPDIQEIVSGACTRLAAGDFGGEVAYQTTLRSAGFSITQSSMSNFMRMLGDQVFIAGQRRLGRQVLLEFNPEPPENTSVPQLFTTAVDIKVTLFLPGPIAGDLTQRGASGVIEVVAAICAFALGKPVELPLALFPAKQEEVERAQALQLDPNILNLARNNISLDIFNEFAALGDLDGVTRVKGALLSYHAALQQASPDVAMMLLVSSMEALIVPRPEWRKDKATKRFTEGIDALCPLVVEELVNHPNVERAFSYRKRGGPRARHRQLLDTIYALRSIPTHSGIGPTGAAMMSMLESPGSLKIALLSDLARGTILSFLQAPWSSLIGHPMFETPPCA
jgi:hypothetical protein